MLDYLKQVLQECLTLPEANSRLAFLIASVTTSVCMAVLVVGFVMTKDRSLYPELVGIVMGGGVSVGVGRYLTKLGDGRQGDVVTPPSANK